MQASIPAHKVGLRGQLGVASEGQWPPEPTVNVVAVERICKSPIATLVLANTGYGS